MHVLALLCLFLSDAIILLDWRQIEQAFQFH
jgi:hypothetical protein